MLVFELRGGGVDSGSCRRPGTNSYFLIFPQACRARPGAAPFPSPPRRPPRPAAYPPGPAAGRPHGTRPRAEAEAP